ncbi:hypothetical protein DFH09DRAFT_1383629 [Mycena vulgaris]|nr:hypothetical protein DFH09DRAFT_1383629 [Mycena vulgaris]
MSHPSTQQFVSQTTRTTFTATGTCILWDESRAHFINWDAHDCASAEHTHEMSFTGEEIVDVIACESRVFVLTRILTGTQWTRPWARRGSSWMDGDIYNLCEHPLANYFVRAFCAAGVDHMGETLAVPHRGVKAVMHAVSTQIIVKVVGQECVASIWRAPNSEMSTWVLIHAELTWDPEIIAKEIGFHNAQAELEYLDAPDDGEDEGPKESCMLFDDVETLDYAFLTDTLVVRLREKVECRADVDFWLEIFQIRQAPSGSPVFSVSPILLNFYVPWNLGQGDMTEAGLMTSDISSQPNSLSIWIQYNGNYSFTVLNIPKLVEGVANPSQFTSHMNPIQLVCYHDLRTDDPFVAHISHGLRPTTAHKTLLFPAFDLDPNYADPAVPLLRFLLFGDVGETPKTINIPINSLDTLLANFHRQDHWHMGYAPFVVSWDGSSRICVVFRRIRREWLREEPSSPRVWFIDLSQEILTEITIQ